MRQVSEEEEASSLAQKSYVYTSDLPTGFSTVLLCCCMMMDDTVSANV